jgi:autotransporter adhesin
MALGSDSRATTTQAIAIGSGSLSQGTLSIALGREAFASGTDNIAIGANASAGFFKGIAIGNGAVAASQGVVIGDSSVSTGVRSTVIGESSSANGNDALVFGSNTNATGDGAMSVGARSQATGNAATALGFFASAGFAGSTAIGANATTTAANQVTLGGPGSAVRIGDIAASDAAQSGGVQMVTVDANGVLGRQAISMEGFGKGASAAEMIALNSRMGLIDGELDNMRAEFRQGIATSVAMTPVQIPSEPGRFTYAFNGSAYRGQYASGGSMMYRLNTTKPMAVGVGFSQGSGKNRAVRIGIAGEF